MRLFRSNSANDAVQLLFYLNATAPLFSRRINRQHARDQIEYAIRETIPRFETKYNVNPVEFMTAVDATRSRLAMFDPYSWERHESVDAFDAFDAFDFM